MVTKKFGTGSGSLDLTNQGLVSGDIAQIAPGNYDSIKIKGMKGIKIQSLGIVGLNHLIPGDTNGVTFDGPINRGNYANGFKWIGSGTKMNSGGGNNVNLVLNGFDNDNSDGNLIDISGDGIVFDGTDAKRAFAGLRCENWKIGGTGYAFFNTWWNHPKTFLNFTRDIVFKTLNLSIPGAGSNEKFVGCNAFRFRAIDWNVTGKGNDSNDIGLIHIEGGNAQAYGMVRSSRFGYSIGRIWHVEDGTITGDQSSGAVACIDKSSDKYGFLSVRMDPSFMQSKDPKIPLRGGNTFVINNTQTNSGDVSGAYNMSPNLLGGLYVDDLGKQWNAYQYNNAIANCKHTGQSDAIYKNDGLGSGYHSGGNVYGETMEAIGLGADYKPGAALQGKGSDLSLLGLPADILAAVNRYIGNPKKPDIGAVQVSVPTTPTVPTIPTIPTTPAKQRTATGFSYVNGKATFSYDDATSSVLPK